MVDVVCIFTGDKYSTEYVVRLERAVDSHLHQSFQFWCVSDRRQYNNWTQIRADSNLPGWWQKLALFRENPFCFDGFGDRLLYLDLDVVITGSLDEIVNFDSSFAMHRDFERRDRNMNASAVMVLDRGAATDIWHRFDENPRAAMDGFHGDQEFITSVCPAPDLLPSRWVVSYKLEAQTGIPDGAKVVCFHGKPKPHECASWVFDKWRVHDDPKAGR
jgi:hypothetical protein